MTSELLRGRHDLMNETLPELCNLRRNHDLTVGLLAVPLKVLVMIFFRWMEGLERCNLRHDGVNPWSILVEFLDEIQRGFSLAVSMVEYR